MRLLFIDHSTHLESVSDLKRRARGGMVSSLFAVTDYLSRRGHDVTVLSDIKSTGATAAGTKWLHEHWGHYDCVVLNRGIGESVAGDVRARARILWTHDLPHSGFLPEPKRARALATVVYMSRYARGIWREFYRDLPRGVIIPNGVAPIFHPREKDLNLMVFASAVNRGLDKLPLILDAVRTRVSQDVRLVAFSNLAQSHPGEMKGFENYDYTPIHSSSVELKDPVPQDVLAGWLGKAGLMILPTNYPEICSNIVLQSLRSGTPIITTGSLGATCEWVKHRKNGMLTRYQPHDYMVHTVEMVRNTVEVLENRRLHHKLIRGATSTSILSWDGVGARWEDLLARYA